MEIEEQRVDPIDALAFYDYLGTGKVMIDFQAGKCPFFLISLKAGGLGLNLTGTNYVETSAKPSLPLINSLITTLNLKIKPI